MLRRVLGVMTIVLMTHSLGCDETIYHRQTFDVVKPMTVTVVPKEHPEELLQFSGGIPVNLKIGDKITLCQVPSKFVATPHGKAVQCFRGWLKDGTAVNVKTEDARTYWN